MPDGVVNVVPTTDAGRRRQHLAGRRAGPQDLVHRLDRRRPDPAPPGRRPGRQRQHGARRQRPVRRHRRRRPRRGGRGSDDRQVPQRRAGVHRRQPVLRARRRRRRVRRPVRRRGRDADGRPPPTAPRSAAHQREGVDESPRWSTAPSPPARGSPTGHDVPDARLVLPADACSPTYRRTRRSCARRSSGRWRPIVTWTDEEELLAPVNDTEFGLAAYVYAGGLQDALRLGRADRGRHGRHQPRPRLRPGRAVRRREAERARAARAPARACGSSRRPSTSASTSEVQRSG